MTDVGQPFFHCLALGVAGASLLSSKKREVQEGNEDEVFCGFVLETSVMSCILQRRNDS